MIFAIVVFVVGFFCCCVWPVGIWYVVMVLLISQIVNSLCSWIKSQNKVAKILSIISVVLFTVSLLLSVASFVIVLVVWLITGSLFLFGANEMHHAAQHGMQSIANN